MINAKVVVGRENVWLVELVAVAVGVGAVVGVIIGSLLGSAALLSGLV